MGFKRKCTYVHSNILNLFTETFHGIKRRICKHINHISLVNRRLPKHLLSNKMRFFVSLYLVIRMSFSYGPFEGNSPPIPPTGRYLRNNLRNNLGKKSVDAVFNSRALPLKSGSNLRQLLTYQLLERY